jgi:uncharacterized protein YaiI (UPF0178 family)
MRIWVDADACPNPIKEILFRAAKRTQTVTILVANQPLRIPTSPLIKQVQVSAGFDVADNYIAQHLAVNDLVITADIPLADEVITKGGIALNPRGEVYSPANIKQKLAVRNFNETLRSSGMLSGGPAPLNAKTIQTFANALDRLLAKQ